MGRARSASRSFPLPCRWPRCSSLFCFWVESWVGLLHEFAVTIMAAILVSGFVSLTLTPMVCRLFLQPHQQAKHGSLFNFFERIQDWVTNVAYAGSLRFVLRHKFGDYGRPPCFCCMAQWHSIMPSPKALCRVKTTA